MRVILVVYHSKNYYLNTSLITVTAQSFIDNVAMGPQGALKKWVLRKNAPVPPPFLIGSLGNQNLVL